MSGSEKHNSSPPTAPSIVRHRGSIDDNDETLSAIIRERRSKAEKKKQSRSPINLLILFSVAIMCLPLCVFWSTKRILFEGIFDALI
jgi:hypothetical protein